MLPFMKRKQIAGLIISHRKPDEIKDPVEPDSSEAAMDACADDILKAIEMKDISKLSSALYAAFEIYDSMPHDEGEPLDEEEV